MSAPITVDAIFRGGKVDLLDPVRYQTLLERAQFGVGEELIVRIESKAEAWRHGDVKHLFGHVYEPVVRYTGISKVELHLQAKALWMPDDGRTSITQLSREELRVFSDTADQAFREDVWEAYERFDPALYYERRARRAA